MYHHKRYCSSVIIYLFFIILIHAEFWKLIQTDATFQMKVGGISAAVLVGAVLAGRGRK